MQTKSEILQDYDTKVNLMTLTLLQIAMITLIVFWIFLTLSKQFSGVPFYLQLTGATTLIILAFCTKYVKNHSILIWHKGESKPFLIVTSGIVLIPFFHSYKLSYVSKDISTYNLKVAETFFTEGVNRTNVSIDADYTVISTNKFLKMGGNQVMNSSIIGNVKNEIHRQIKEGYKVLNADEILHETIEYIEEKHGVIFNDTLIFKLTNFEH